jgi:PIN domain nuclease of toxin-antitoxin system
VLAAERYILDTSAVLALTDQEDGFEKVEELAIIAAVARLHEAVLLHKDPEFETLADEISLLSLPYK